MRKFVITILIIALTTILAGTAVAEAEYARVLRYSDAYLEPDESDLYYAGKFASAGIVRIIDTVQDDWINIEYLVSNSSEENTSPETRSVYVRKSALMPLDAPDSIVMNPNEILTGDETKAGEEPASFDESMLVDMRYTPQSSEKSTLSLTYTNRTKTVGENADFSDALVEQAGGTYVGTSRIVFTPDVRINGETQYPIDMNAIRLLTSENKEYHIDNEYITNKRMLAGLRFILENSPPYKVYASYPSDYVEASRTAAALAIRAFVKDTSASGDWLDIFTGITPYNINAFSQDYIGYMYWLYQGAMENYNAYEETEVLYISTDILTEPEEENGVFEIDVRVTTNADSGWKIEKKSLDPQITDIRGAKESESLYFGEKGTLVITVVISEEAQGQAVVIPILYNTESTIIQTAVPEDGNNPVMISLSCQDKDNPPKKMKIQLPKSSLISFAARMAGERTPVPNVSLTVTSEKGRRYYLTTNENGTAECLVPSGTYTYSVINYPDSLETSAQGSFTADKDHSISLDFKERTYTLHVRIENAVTHELILQEAKVSLYSANDTETPVWTGVIANGEADIEDLKAGKYILRQETELSRYEATSDVSFNLGRENTTCAIPNPPLSGYLMISAVMTRTGTALEGFEVNVYNSDNTLIDTLRTDAEGSAVSKRIPVGEYTIAASRIPDGYALKDKTDSKKTEVVKYNGTTKTKWSLDKREYKINVYTREQTGIDKFSATEIPHESGMCNLNGCVFQLIAAEDIRGNAISYSAGDNVLEFPATATRNAVASGSILLPGKYILHEVMSSPGYLPADDVEIEINEDQVSYDIPVLKTPISMALDISAAGSDGEPKAGTEFYVYSAKYQSYNAAKDGYKFYVSTDENGSAVIGGVCYGKWTVVRAKESRKDKEFKSQIDISSSGEISIRYMDGIPGGLVRIDLTDSEGAAISTSAAFKLYRDDGTQVVLTDEENAVFEINGSGYIPATLENGEYYLEEVKSPDGYELAEKTMLTVNDAGETTTVAVSHSTRKKSIAVRVLIPEIGNVSGYKYNSDQYRIAQYALEYRSVENVSVIGLSAPLETAFSLKTISDGNIITTPLDVGTYYLLAGDLPNGYIASDMPIKINTAENSEKIAYVDIHLRAKPTIILFYPHESSQGAKNGAQYGLYAEGQENRQEEAHAAPLAVKTAANGMVCFVGEYPSGNYFIAPVKDMDGTYEAGTETRIKIKMPGVSVKAAEKNLDTFEVQIGAVDHGTKEELTDTFVVLSEAAGEIYKGYLDENNRTFDLRPGTYYLQSTLAPEGYAINTNMYTFTVNDDGTISGTTFVPLKPAAVRVMVRDSEGPVEGSTLLMRNTETGKQYTGTTDRDGIAEFEYVGYGSYEISECFPAAGYQVSNAVIRIRVDGLYANPKEPVAVLDTTQNTLRCSVFVSDGTPVQNAEIELLNNYGNIIECVLTDESGEAVFRGIPYGSYKVRTRNVPEIYLMPDSEYAFVVGNRTRGCIDRQFVFACRQKTLEYRLVIGNSGEPVYGAEFTAIRKDDASVTEHVKTGVDGRFSFSRFGYGEYIVREVYAPEGTAKIDDFEFVIDRNWTQPPEETLSTAYNYFELESFDNKGNPLGNVQFTVENQTTGEKTSSRSDENGRVCFNHLKMATYVVSVSSVPDGYILPDETLTIALTDQYSPAETPYRFIVRVEE